MPERICTVAPDSKILEHRKEQNVGLGHFQSYCPTMGWVTGNATTLALPREASGLKRSWRTDNVVMH
jgi:hypothetical protein